MKNIERGTIKYLILLILFTAICGLILFPIFDAFSDLLTNSKFTYSVEKHVVMPVVFAVVYGITFWAFDKRKKK